MRLIHRLAPIVALLVVAAACGDDSSGSTTVPTSPTTTTPATTTTTEATTTTAGPTGTVSDMVGAMVEDPLMETGFHTMEWGDAEMTHLRSTMSLDGSDSESNRLAVGPVPSSPTESGVQEGSLLLSVWIENYDGDIVPRAVTLFTSDAEGWVAGPTLSRDNLLEFLETTTDYDAAAPAGPPLVNFQVTHFDGAGPTFVAGVTVTDHSDPDAEGYQGEVECSYATPLDCVLLSDDGVLRPGDEGEAVEALQEDMVTLGYYTGAIDGEYGPATEGAVRALQRDYRLTRDGRAGPNTLSLIEALVDGTSDIIMASPSGVGDVLFGTDDNDAYAALVGILGTPDTTTGWYVDACDGHDWFKGTWDGFTAIFTDRDGFRQFDGWHVDDITNVPDWLYFAYGIGPGTDWDYLQTIGAVWNPGYGGFWANNDIGYNNGRFFPGFSDPPAGDDQVKSFGTGTGAFVSC